MEFFKRVGYTLYKIYLAGLFIASMVIFYPLFVFYLNSKRFRVVLELERWWQKLLFPLAGIQLKVSGKNNFPEPPYIICPNHSSYLDILLMFRVIPHYFVFMGKQELASWPIFNLFFTKGMNILVDRKNKSASAASYKRAVKEIEKNHCLVIFPEATIPATVPIMMRFKDGAFALAIDKQIPIVPITFLDNYKRLRSGGFMKSMSSPGSARVIVHKPINTKGLNQTDLISLRQNTFDIIQNPLLKNGN